jgi:hypothetical protein
MASTTRQHVFIDDHEVEDTWTKVVIHSLLLVDNTHILLTAGEPFIFNPKKSSSPYLHDESTDHVFYFR